MYSSSKSALSNRLAFFVLALILTGLLAGCSDEVTATPQPPLASPIAFRPGANVPSSTEAVPTATSAPTNAPVFLPTVTATAVPARASRTPEPSATPAPAVAEQQDQGFAGSAPPTVPGIKLSDLPLVNGMPKIPLTNLPAPIDTTPARKANYGANGQPKVGIQVGHWMNEQLPDQLASLRGQTGGSGGGVREVDFNLDIARRVVKLLQDKGYEVDLIPATVPVNYTADAFVAIHADANTSASPSGYKLARSRFSPIPQTDDALMNAVTATYGKATGFRWDDNITRNMSGYYAFNNRRRIYAVSKGTPAIIVETGYLTNAADRNYLISNKDTVANGIAQGVVNFLQARPPLAQREKASAVSTSLLVAKDNVAVYDKVNGTPIAYLAKDQRFDVFEVRDDYYMVVLPYLNKAGFIRRADATTTSLPR